MKSVQAYTGSKPILLIGKNENSIVVCFPGYIVNYFGFKLFVSPREGWQIDSMGPLFADSEFDQIKIIDELIAYLFTYQKIAYIEFTTNLLDKDPFSQYEQFRKEVFTYHVQLFPENKEQVLKNFDKKTRNQLRKAIKLGLVAMVDRSDEFAVEFYNQIKQVFEGRYRYLVFSFKRVKSLHYGMRESENYLPISIYMPDGKTCIATGIFLVYRNELTLWGWAHRKEYRWYCPTELLVWKAMEIAMERGCTQFDLSGGGEYKLNFGAKPYHGYYRYFYSKYKIITQLRLILGKMYRSKQRIERKMLRIFSKILSKGKNA